MKKNEKSSSQASKTHPVNRNNEEKQEKLISSFKDPSSQSKQ
jgi:hypothetical protein